MKQVTTLEVKENGVTVDLAVPYLLTTEIKAQEYLLQGRNNLKAYT